MGWFLRPNAGNDTADNPILFTGNLSWDLIGRISWEKTSANGYTVVGLPHPSRYNVIGKTDVVNWIMGRKAL